MFIHKNLAPVPAEDEVRGEVTQTQSALGSGCRVLPQLLQTACAESCALLALRGTAD